MTTTLKPWAKISHELTKGLNSALMMTSTRRVAVDFCRTIAEQQGGATTADSPKRWLQDLRKEARKIGPKEYKRVYSLQQYHWAKLVHEMRRLESDGLEIIQ